VRVDHQKRPGGLVAVQRLLHLLLRRQQSARVDLHGVLFFMAEKNRVLGRVFRRRGPTLLGASRPRSRAYTSASATSTTAAPTPARATFVC